jgi:very-short-patch-repair endonuclease
MGDGCARKPSHADCIDHLIGGECSPHGVEGGLDWLLAELGRRQHGVVGRTQLLKAGAGRRMIDVRLARGALHSLQRGVYSVGHRSLSVRGRWMAAVLASGSGAVLSHRSAGALWGLQPRTSAEIEVTRSTTFRGRPGVRAHRSSLPADEITVVDAIPVTTVPRTLLDLAAIVSKRQLEQALNEAEIRRLTDALSVPDLLERYPRRPGSAALRELLGDEAALLGITRNDFEEAFVALVDAHRLPRPRFNADVVVRGRHFNVDCLWRERHLIVELDGREVHGTARAFETDRERDRLLLADGWRVMRLTWRQIRDAPAEIVADLRVLLEDAPVAGGIG